MQSRDSSQVFNETELATQKLELYSKHRPIIHISLDLLNDGMIVSYSLSTLFRNDKLSGIKNRLRCALLVVILHGPPPTEYLHHIVRITIELLFYNLL